MYLVSSAMMSVHSYCNKMVNDHVELCSHVKRFQPHMRHGHEISNTREFSIENMINLCVIFSYDRNNFNQIIIYLQCIRADVTKRIFGQILTIRRITNITFIPEKYWMHPINVIQIDTLKFV